MNLIIQSDALATNIKTSLATILDGSSPIYRQLANDLIPVIHDRIHLEGKNASDREIGTYSNAYLKLRTGDYGNATRVSRGTNKGKRKDAGVSTKGSNAGKARAKYNRDSDRKVIISLTRQLENDYTVKATDRGYGIGFNNPFNLKKANWNNVRYGAPIYGVTESEILFIQKRIAELINAS